MNNYAGLSLIILLTSAGGGASTGDDFLFLDNTQFTFLNGSIFEFLG